LHILTRGRGLAKHLDCSACEQRGGERETQGRGRRRKGILHRCSRRGLRTPKEYNGWGLSVKITIDMTLDELEREYVPLRQQALAVRSYL
jgi:hypothetical protein